MHIAAHKPAVYAAALCTVLPLAAGANASTRNTVVSPDPEVRLVRYMDASRMFTNEARLHGNADPSGERGDPPQLPVRPNGLAPCDLIATLPSGTSICFFIQW